MSTTPPEQPGPAYGVRNMPMDVARLPIPGNAEFAVYFLALIVAWLVTFTVLTAFYLLSRGIAKAARVLEQ